MQQAETAKFKWGQEEKKSRRVVSYTDWLRA